MGIASMAILLTRTGDSETAARYRDTARTMARSWVSRAAKGDGSFRLAFDQPDTFSLKYNIVWEMPSVDGNAYYWMWDYAWSESYFSSKVDDEKFDRILQIYDYLLSDEGVMLSRYGVEGETYEIVDGKYVQESPDARTVFPSINLFHDLVAWTPVEPYEYISLIPEDILAVTEARIEDARNAPVPEFDSRYTDIFVSMGTDFGLSLGDDMLTIMTGDRPVEEMWQEIIDRYKAAGLEDIIQQVNDTAKELGYQG